MTLRHYGGRVPEVASTWTCPSCSAENSTPLKAGCQQCGAGGDARKVGGLAPETQAMIAEENARGARVRSEPAEPAEPAEVAERAFYLWAMGAQPDNKTLGKEAF